MFTLLRRLRHGPLKNWASLWKILGDFYRISLRFLGIFGIRTSTSMKIGPYGPFKLDSRFTFSNFEQHGDHSKTVTFRPIIEAATNTQCVFDIGAHVGLITLPASKLVAPGGRVYAFEPSDFNRAMLLRHIALNDANNVEVVGDLVGAKDESEIVFYQQSKDSTMNTVVEFPKDSHWPKLPSMNTTRKRQICLDTFCKERDLKPDVIKINTQGAEFGVLKGAEATIRAAQPTIFLSVHPQYLEILGSSVDELSKLIDDLWYVCVNYLGKNIEVLAHDDYILHPKQIN
ncbi:MAG: FkbM family methyltransferase [Rhodospirillaceae bacterium]|jgi:FkbM family methyltransferase|nr:FkbM family methyltransferase [Rhodospirillaceae bacterium]